MPRFLVWLSVAVVVACGPSRNSEKPCDNAVDCMGGTCNPSDVRDCYTGAMGTKGTGVCKGGQQTCTAAGTWGDCQGEVVPRGEVCGNGKDEDCDGKVDENTDLDGDGWTTCDGDCCDSNECDNPSQVNPGAYEVAGDGVDNDCDGQVDNAIPTCDAVASGNSTNPYDYAAAIDLCPSTSLQGAALMSDPQRHWGIIDAKLTLADGTGSPNMDSGAILPHYGTGVMPHAGSKLMLISSGYAAGESDPNFDPFLSGTMGTTSGFPSDWLQANGGNLPTAPSCPAGDNTGANDPYMLTLKIRVPTNANSFSMDIDFFSDEFPEWTCSPYNDFFVVLLDSTYSGMPANPTDKNLAFYTDPSMKKYPVGVNLAAGNTGLFTECLDGTTGCEGALSGGVQGNIMTCKDTTQLQGTGLEMSAAGECDSNSLMGGGTGWLVTSGNVKPGEIMTLRIAIWDTSDEALDSMAVIDNFHWNVQTSNPGTVIQ